MGNLKYLMLAHKGNLKLRPIRAHIMREGIVDHVKPFLVVEFKNEHWKSHHREGHRVEWGHEGHFEHHVQHPHDELIIKMMDHEGLMNNEPIGHWKGEAAHFCHKNGEEEMEIQLMHMGPVAATVVMHVHFHKD